MKKILPLLFCIIFFSLQAQAAIKVTPTVIEMDTKGARSNYVTSCLPFKAVKMKQYALRFILNISR